MSQVLFTQQHLQQMISERGGFSVPQIRLSKEITKEISGGARINYIYEVVFKKAIQKIDPFDNLSDDDIRRAIKNANALRPALFVPEGAFEILIKKQIQRLY